MPAPRDSLNEVQDGFPLRAFWAWPLGFGLVGATEVSIQFGRLGGGGVAALLGVAAAATTGLLVGALVLLCTVLWRRRGLPQPHVSWTRLTAPLLAAALACAVAWVAVGEVASLSRTRQFDFQEDMVDLGRALLLLSIPVGVVSLMVAARWVERRCSTWAGWPWLGKTALTLMVVWALHHACKGFFAIHLSPALGFGLALAATLAVAVWIPASLTRPRAAVWVLGPAPVLAAIGFAGYHQPSARALLLHDTRVFPAVHETMWEFLDLDGDGELPTSLGGLDCDDGDPHVASWRPEHPGNGIDDNCFGGDLATLPPTLPTTTSGTPGRHPVFLFTIDTVRADATDLGGAARETMPYLRVYAESGRWFSRAYSPSNHTAFSMLSILSGQTPDFFVADPDVFAKGGKRFTTWLPHQLGRIGYETWALNPPMAGFSVPASELRVDKLLLGPFDHAPKNRGTRSRQIADAFSKAMRARETDERPLFAWIHIGDPHAEHASHEHFPERSTRDAYDNELRWVDVNLAEMLSEIHRRYGDDAIVIITSDHGEEFGERGSYGHGFSLREGMIHVPLAMRGPGIEAGRVDTPVQVTGIPATVLELVGAAPAPTMRTPSLLGKPEPVVVSTPTFWSETRMEVALVQDRYKLIVHRKAGTRALFDLETDPGETENLVDVDPQRADAMYQTLRERLEELR
jgi:arylsulfatase A-like enzyme